MGVFFKRMALEFEINTYIHTRTFMCVWGFVHLKLKL